MVTLFSLPKRPIERLERLVNPPQKGEILLAPNEEVELWQSKLVKLDKDTPLDEI